MRIALLGNEGQLGWELQRTLAALGEVIVLEYPEIDLRKPRSISELLRQISPDIIVNATAYTSVDKAEDDPDTALVINGQAPGVLAETARSLKAGLVHYSTDYVFDGKKGAPYTEADIPNPLNVYGQSKLAGENAVQENGGAYLIIRTSWVYSLRRDNFVTKVLEWTRQQRTVRVVNDQFSNPTWCRMLAEATAQLLVMGISDIVGWLTDHHGLYHLAGSGVTNRYDWAKAILENDPCKEEQIVEQLLPASSSEFPTPANRPLYSALSSLHFYKTFGLKLPEWQDSLRLAMQPG